MMPLVTVLMPAYNSGEYITEAIQSVVNQTYSNWELVIVNDGSTDDTVEKVQQFQDERIRLFHNPKNLGLAPTRNRALQEARGELVMVLDSDDRALPDRLELQVESLRQHPDWVAVGGKSNLINRQGEVVQDGRDIFVPKTSAAIRFASSFRFPFRHSSVTFRKAPIDSLGGYPELIIEDFGLFARIVEKFETANLPQVVCDYRVHSNSWMGKLTSQVSATRQEPRRVEAAELYSRCAEINGVSKEDALVFGKLWSLVRFPIQGEWCDVAKTRKYLLKVHAYRPRGKEVCLESAEICIWTFVQLMRIAKNQRSFFQLFLTAICASWHQNVNLIKVLMRRRSGRLNQKLADG